jgi:hypothetical protein
LNQAAPVPEPLPHLCTQALELWLELRNDDIDAAIDAGLMRFVPCPACDAQAVAVLGECRARLQQA